MDIEWLPLTCSPCQTLTKGGNHENLKSGQDLEPHMVLSQAAATIANSLDHFHKILSRFPLCFYMLQPFDSLFDFDLPVR